MEPTKYAISPYTVQKLRATFARFGIPETVVTEIGLVFPERNLKIRNAIRRLNTSASTEKVTIAKKCRFHNMQKRLY